MNTPHPLLRSNSTPIASADNSREHELLLRVTNCELEIEQLRLQLEYKDKFIEVLKEKVKVAEMDAFTAGKKDKIDTTNNS